MNINDLTVGQAKELAALFSTNNQSEANAKVDPLIGRYVICRCSSAGVHAGEVISQEGDVVFLKNTRRLWSWKAKSGIALSGVAAHGLADGCKVDSKLEMTRLTGVIESMLCTDLAKESIDGY